MESGDKKSYNLKSYIIAGLGIIFGLVLIILSEHIDEKINPVLHNISATLATTFLVGGLLGVAYEIALRGELIAHFEHAIDVLRSDVAGTVDRVDRRIQLSGALDEIGLHLIEPKESSFDYADMITKSKNMHFIFNDGRTWFSQHHDDMHRRLEKPGFTTTVILVHPESPFIDALAVKVDDTAEELRNKILGTIRLLSRIKSADHTLKIVGHMLPSSYSLIMNEDQAVYVPYPMARKAARIPCFVFTPNNDGFFSMLRRDVASIVNHLGTKTLFPDELL